MSSADRRPPLPSAEGTRHDVAHRENGLDTLARVNRWMVAGSLALAGGASVVTWHAFEAHAAGLATPISSVVAADHHHRSSDVDGGGASSAPAAPASAPTPAQVPAPATPAPAVSGGS